MRSIFWRKLPVFSHFLVAGLMAVGLGLAGSVQAVADPALRGLQGAIGGAIVGGAVKGGKGVLPGAAIGGVVGIIGGAIEEEHRRSKRKYRRARRHNNNYRHTRATPRHRAHRPAPAYDTELVADIQDSLLTLGYDPGPVDGVLGPKTVAAIEEYQNNYGLPLTGEPTAELHDHMVRQGG